LKQSHHEEWPKFGSERESAKENTILTSLKTVVWLLKGYNPIKAAEAVNCKAYSISYEGRSEV
jgi:hypothetical protein